MTFKMNGIDDFVLSYLSTILLYYAVILTVTCFLALSLYNRTKKKVKFFSQSSGQRVFPGRNIKLNWRRCFRVGPTITTTNTLETATC